MGDATLRRWRWSAVEIVILMFAVTISLTIIATLSMIVYANLSGAELQKPDAGRGKAVLHVLDSMVTVVTLYIGYAMKEKFGKGK